MNRMSIRRALVLTHEQARHPFRQTLPAHVFIPLADEDKPSEKRSLRQVFEEEWKSLLSTYCAAFVMLTAFLA